MKKQTLAGRQPRKEGRAVKRFRDLKIRAKLVTGFIIVALIGGIIGGAGYLGMVQIDKNAELIAGNYLVCTQWLYQIREGQELLLLGAQILMNPLLNEANYNAAHGYVVDGRKGAESALAKLDAMPGSGEQETQWLKFKEAWTVWIGVVDQALSAISERETLMASGKSKDDPAVNALLLKAINVTANAAGNTRAELEQSLQTLINLNDKLAKEAVKAADDAYARSMTTLISVMVLGTVLAVVLGIFLSNLVSKPIQQVTDVAKSMAVGDISRTVEATSKDEVGVLAGAFSEMIDSIKSQVQAVEKMAAGDLTVDIQPKSDKDVLSISLGVVLDSLNEILSGVQEAAQQVGAAANQISSSAQGVAQGTAEQASSLEEVSSSLEEISSMTKNNAENAGQAQSLAGVANNAADQGKAAVSEMTDAIGAIKVSSDETARIVKTIDDIAFQTNLLALNAAVEAARAGEAGRGFAVVAEEVRNLALRSAEAAKETARMIEDSVKKSDNGVKIVQDVDRVLLDLADGVRKVNNLVSEIAAASAEQSRGVDQVAIATSQMNKVTQSNASSAEESASAAEELSSQVTQLNGMLSKFKLRGHRRSDAKLRGGYGAAQPEARGFTVVRPASLDDDAKPDGAASAKKPGRLIPLEDDDFKGF